MSPISGGNCERTILHVDMNNFFASVECLYRPDLKGKPVVVGGDPELRHGVVLAKNYPAKACGVKTGEALWQARQKCPSLQVVKPNYPLYLRFSRKARKIYNEYTDRIEPFGLDEAWLDVSGRDGKNLADELRGRIQAELGITASVGVSFNKVFAKLGSDLKKPDATTVISKDNYRELVWPLPVEELLYIGGATRRKLYDRAILSIGDLAQCSVETLHSTFGKVGYVLSSFANGYDNSPVARLGEESVIKSIGNSATTPRDLVCDADAKAIFYVMSESVAARLREHELRCTTVQIHVRDNELNGFERQIKLKSPTDLSGAIALAAFGLFQANYRWARPIRSLGVRGANLVSAHAPQQLSFFDEPEREKAENLERAIDSLRTRFGHFSIQRAALLADGPLGAINPKEDHVVHPVGFFKDGGMV